MWGRVVVSPLFVTDKAPNHHFSAGANVRSHSFLSASDWGLAVPAGKNT